MFLFTFNFGYCSANGTCSTNGTLSICVLRMEINQASGDQSVCITIVTHYDITMGNNVSMDAYCAITMTCDVDTIREESHQTNVILQYKLLASILSAVCSVI